MTARGTFNPFAAYESVKVPEATGNNEHGMRLVEHHSGDGFPLAAYLDNELLPLVQVFRIILVTVGIVSATIVAGLAHTESVEVVAEHAVRRS